MIDDRTTHYSWPKVHETNNPRLEDVPRLRDFADQVDAKINALESLNGGTFATKALAEAALLAATPDALRLMGYAHAGDGGGAPYVKVEAEPTHPGKLHVADSWYEIASATLAPEMFGAVANDAGLASANALAVNDLLATMAALHRPIRARSGDVYHTDGVHILASDFCDIGSDGEGYAILKSPATSGTILSVSPAAGVDPKATVTLTANARFGAQTLTVSSTSAMMKGDILRLVSNKAWYNDPRETAGFVEADANAATAQAGSASTITLRSGHTTPAATVIGASLTIRRGGGVGQARRVIAFDEGTKVATVTPDWGVAPDSTSVYQFPQATKGQTTRVRRVIDATTVEIEDSLYDGYHVSSGSNIKEEVSVEIYSSFSPRIKIGVEGPEGSHNLNGVSVVASALGCFDVHTVGTNRNGLRVLAGYGNDVRVEIDRINDAETGYGCQISHCAHTRVTGKGFEFRRVVDVSGTTPCDYTILHDIVAVGGGLREDGTSWFPLDTPANSGVGSHGPGRNTIYERCFFDGVDMGIFERGFGCTIRHCYFGPRVGIPIYLSHGGPVEIYGNVCDPKGEENFTGTNFHVEDGDFGGASGDTGYPEFFVVVGAGNDAIRHGGTDVYSRIVVRDNIVRTMRGLVGIEHSTVTTRVYHHPNIFGNDCEYFPASPSDAVGLIGRYGPGTSGIRLGSSVGGCCLGPNKQRTADGNTPPVLYFGTNVAFSTAAGTKINFGDGRWSIILADDSAGWVPAPQIGRDRLGLSLATDAVAASTYILGWIGRNSTNLGAASKSSSVEATATAGTGTTGTDARLNLHFDVGRLTIENRLGSTQTINLQVGTMG